MTIKVGDRLPDATFKVMKDGKPADLTTAELSKGKKLALFAVPGAFTPTCSVKHLPGYKEKAAELRAKGVDTIACVSVNDVFVMNAWGKDQQVVTEHSVLRNRVDRGGRKGLKQKMIGIGKRSFGGEKDVGVEHASGEDAGGVGRPGAESPAENPQVKVGVAWSLQCPE